MSKFLGEFEQLVLLAILRLGEAAYGVAVIREIGARAGRSVSRGALYVTLDRLEDKGLLRSRQGSATPERGGRAKRLLAVTAAGRRALKQSRNALLEMWSGLEEALR